MTFQTFTGKEYLKIDIANSFGLDKRSWDDRIAWFDDNEHQLRNIMKDAEEPALFYAGILAWEDTLAGKPSGYPISLDATCSGIQVLAALAGDRSAARMCNVVDTGAREDAYTGIYKAMVDKLGDTAKIDRKMTKNAIMTAFYGSTARPKQVFGEGELLNIFYQTLESHAPGAWEINKTMLSIWDSKTLMHEWILPDNFHVKVKVMGQNKETVHFLNEPFEVIQEINRPVKDGRSLGANLVHSLDGMIVREMQNRCNYDQAHIYELERLIHVRASGRSKHRPKDALVQTLWSHYNESGFLSSRILQYLDIDNLGLVNLGVIAEMINDLPPKSFEVISIHDCFRCLPNYGNDLRRQYNHIFCLLYTSDAADE